MMTYSTLPKEYLLHQPANYDEVKVMAWVKAIIKTYGFTFLYNDSFPFYNIVNKGEHLEIFTDIFRYLVDIKVKEDEFIKHMHIALIDAGFFGV